MTTAKKANRKPFRMEVPRKANEITIKCLGSQDPCTSTSYSSLLCIPPATHPTHYQLHLSCNTSILLTILHHYFFSPKPHYNYYSPISHSYLHPTACASLYHIATPLLPHTSFMSIHQNQTPSPVVALQRNQVWRQNHRRIRRKKQKCSSWILFEDSFSCWSLMHKG